jgi:hypothetical protein
MNVDDILLADNGNEASRVCNRVETRGVCINVFVNLQRTYLLADGIKKPVTHISF